MSFSVLHVLDHTWPMRSGYTVRTEHILRAQQQLGYRLHMVSSPRQDPECNTNIMVGEVLCWRTAYVTAKDKRRGLWRLVREPISFAQTLRAVIDDVKPKIIHVHSPILNFWPAWWAARRRNIPIVYEIRAFWEDAAVASAKTTPDSLRYNATRYAETMSCRKADHVFTICQGLRDDLLLRGIAADKMSIAPNVIAPQLPEVAPAPAHLQEQFAGCTVLGFMGGLYKYEGVDTLLHAFDLLADKHPQLRLLIVGDGPERDHIYGIHRALRHRERVVLTGSLPHHEALSCYALCDAIVLPRVSTRLTETVTPMKIPEAQQHGVLAIASDVGGHREMIINGETGFLVNAQNPATLMHALEHVLLQQEHWAHIATQAQQRVQQERSYQVLGQAYKTVYERLCDGKF